MTHVSRHSWEYKKDYVDDGVRFMVFVCHCGACKIVEREVILDESRGE